MGFRREEQRRMRTRLRGAELLRNPRLSKSGAFNEAEREQLGIVGLVPESIDSESVQLERVSRRVSARTSSFEKYLELAALQDTDETLFYRALRFRLVTFLPLVYKPAVGAACMKFGEMIARPKGSATTIASAASTTISRARAPWFLPAC